MEPLQHESTGKYTVDEPYAGKLARVKENRRSYEERNQQNIARFFLADALYYACSYARSGTVLARAALHGAVTRQN